MEVLGLGVKSEMQLPAYTTATAMPDPRCICDLCCRLWQCQILNPLSEARDQNDMLMDTSQVLNQLSHSGNSRFLYLLSQLKCDLLKEVLTTYFIFFKLLKLN